MSFTSVCVFACVRMRIQVDAQSIVPSLVDSRAGGWQLAMAFHSALQVDGWVGDWVGE